ncbi:MAG: MATE family efflux transporter [Clostridia bacterium]|nr:MATE family efflux transporter [Clostridia bacterium]
MLASIVALGWPTMLEQFFQTAVQYIDTAMVGSLGTHATAAVGCTGTVNWLIGGLVSAMGVGFLALISQSIGARRPEKARAAAAQSLSVTLITGLALTALIQGLANFVPGWMQADPLIRGDAAMYFRVLHATILLRALSIIPATVLRAAGDTRTPMRIALAVNGVNVALNFLLIYPARTVTVFSHGITLPGAGLGIAGAAWASSLAYGAVGIVTFLKMWNHPAVSPRGCSLRPDRRILGPVFRVTLPNMLQRFATSMGYVVFASLINALGETSTAAHTVANTVESAFYIPGWGMQAAAATLAGFALGEGSRKKLKRLGNTFLPLEIALMVASGALLFLLAGPLVRIFTRDGEVVRLGTTVLRMVAVSEPFYGVPIVTEGMMQGCGETRIPLVFNLIGMWGVRVLGTFLFTRVWGYGLVSAWGCMIGHNMLLFFLFGAWYLSGRWNPLEKSGKKRRKTAG